MGRCCGGKNAGKPISKGRYVAGLAVFAAYHGGVAAALHAAAVPFSGLKRVRDFHRALAWNDLREVLARNDIHIGQAGPDDEACPVDAVRG